MKPDRPEIVNDEHLRYLGSLRESAITNMWGAGAYVQKVFKVSAKDASLITTYWMESFGDDDR